MDAMVFANLIRINLALKNKDKAQRYLQMLQKLDSRHCRNNSDKEERRGQTKSCEFNYFASVGDSANAVAVITEILQGIGTKYKSRPILIVTLAKALSSRLFDGPKNIFRAKLLTITELLLSTKERRLFTHLDIVARISELADICLRKNEPSAAVEILKLGTDIIRTQKGPSHELADIMDLTADFLEERKLAQEKHTWFGFSGGTISSLRNRADIIRNKLPEYSQEKTVGLNSHTYKVRQEFYGR